MNQLLYWLYFEFFNRDRESGLLKVLWLINKVSFISTMLFKANYRAISSTFHKIWTYMLFLLLCYLTHLFLCFKLKTKYKSLCWFINDRIHDISLTNLILNLYIRIYDIICILKLQTLISNSYDDIQVIHIYFT